MFEDERHPKNLRETEQERILRQLGDVYGYYLARMQRGDRYAETALQVVMNQGGLGKAANFGLKWTAFLHSTDYNEYEVNIRLMNAHGAAVHSDMNGIPGLLNNMQITKYHHEVFEQLGLPHSTFGGTPVTGMMWESNVWNSIWCEGCDTE